MSSGLLTATSPAGSGTVDVTVTAGGVTSATSPSDHFTYIPVPVPTVTRVTPNAAPAGTVVSIQGTNYTPSATVSFGAHPSTGVRFISPTQLLAVAPSAGGTIDVRVTANSVTSPVTSADHFTFPLQTVTRVLVDIEFAGWSVSVLGTNFSANDVAYFGSTVASTFYTSPTVLTATVPSGTRTVNVTVHLDSTTSIVSPFDQFTYRTFVGAQPSNHTGLPLAYDAEPFWISNQISGRGTGAILASNVSNSEIVIYKGGPKTYVNQTLQAFTLQTDLTGLNQLGSTLTSLPGGVPGQVSTATEGSWTLVAYTNRVGDRMSVQTLQSGDYGNHWNVTYSSTSTRGMVLDPQVVSSPAGYFYLTWRDSGVGPWEVDYAVLEYVRLCSTELVDHSRSWWDRQCPCREPVHSRRRSRAASCRLGFVPIQPDLEFERRVHRWVPVAPHTDPCAQRDLPQSHGGGLL